MQDNQQQNNGRIREIRKRRFTLNGQQKERLEKVFLKELQPNFLEREYLALVVHGVPTEFRNYIWTQLIPNHHQISPAMYIQLVEQLKNYQDQNLQSADYFTLNSSLKRKASLNIADDLNPETLSQGNSKIYKWISIIKQDIPRTFPEIKIFHSDPEQYERLSNILGSFALFRSDIGYIQGLSLIASLFLQELNTEYRAFTALTTLVTTTILYDFYTFNDAAISKMCESMNEQIQEQSGSLHQLLVEMNIDIKIIVIEWVMTLFSRIFQLDSILNLWDLLLAHRMKPYIFQQLCISIILIRKDSLLSISQPSCALKLLKSTKLSFSEQERIFSLMQTVQFSDN